MQTLTLVTAGLMAVSSIMTPPIAAASPIEPSPSAGPVEVFVEAPGPDCDRLRLRRVFYQTAWSSAAIGMDHVMTAFGSKDWCVSNANQAWCPDLVNGTVSAIAAKAINRTLVPENDNNAAAFVTGLADISVEAAFDAMMWARRMVNGSTMSTGGKSDAVKKMEWTIESLQRQKHAVNLTDADVEQAEQDASQPSPAPETALIRARQNHETKGQQKAVAIVGYSVGGLGLAFVTGVTGCAVFSENPFVKSWCGTIEEGKVPYTVTKLFNAISNLPKRALPEWHWLRYLQRAAREFASDIPPVPEPLGPGQLWLPYHNWVRDQTADTWYRNQDSDFNLEDLDLPDRENPPYDTWAEARADAWDDKARVMKEDLMHHAPEEEVPEHLREQGYHAFRRVEFDHYQPSEGQLQAPDFGQKIVYRRLEDLHPLGPRPIQGQYGKTTWQYHFMGSGKGKGPMPAYLTRDDMPEVDPLGQPIVGVISEAEDFPDYLATLIPVREPAEGEPGPSNWRQYNLRDPFGNLLNGLDDEPFRLSFDADDLESSIRLSLGSDPVAKSHNPPSDGHPKPKSGKPPKNISLKNPPGETPAPTAKLTRSVEATHSTQVAETVEHTESAHATHPAEITDSVRPTQSSEPAGFEKATESVDSTQHAEPAESAKATPSTEATATPITQEISSDRSPFPTPTRTTLLKMVSPSISPEAASRSTAPVTIVTEKTVTSMTTVFTTPPPATSPTHHSVTSKAPESPLMPEECRDRWRVGHKNKKPPAWCARWAYLNGHHITAETLTSKTA